ncbi:legume-like lectin family-domain-containing protein [Chytriomyces cf. hyalinus JEL632]|nr:legume-like lectin family-domain-containing protein [Chytriomyces cf. hyalinus JEL632]
MHGFSLVALLATLLVSVAHAQTVEVKDSDLHEMEHFTLLQPYVDEYLMNRYWDFGADTYVNVNQFVRLTANKQSKRGWLWTRMPVVTQKSWVVEFEFKVSGGDRLFGDGFAFWYTTDRRKTGDVFGNQDEFNGLGVFFDTYANGRNRAIFPYINAMIGDGKTKYDQSTDGKSNEIGSCTAYFREKEFLTRAKVVYVEDKLLELYVDVDGLNTWKPCFSVKDVTLPERGYFGFTSHTGDASDNHDIIRVNAYSIDNEHTKSPSKPAQDYGKSFNTPTRPNGNVPTATPVVAKSGGSYFWTGLVVIICVFVVAGIAVAAYVAYSKMNSPKAYKRF